MGRESMAKAASTADAACSLGNRPKKRVSTENPEDRLGEMVHGAEQCTTPAHPDQKTICEHHHMILFRKDI